MFPSYPGTLLRYVFGTFAVRQSSEGVVCFNLGSFLFDGLVCECLIKLSDQELLVGHFDRNPPLAFLNSFPTRPTGLYCSIVALDDGRPARGDGRWQLVRPLCHVRGLGRHVPVVAVAMRSSKFMV